MPRFQVVVLAQNEVGVPVEKSYYTQAEDETQAAYSVIPLAMSEPVFRGKIIDVNDMQISNLEPVK